MEDHHKTGELWEGATVDRIRDSERSIAVAPSASPSAECVRTCWRCVFVGGISLSRSSCKQVNHLLRTRLRCDVALKVWREIAKYLCKREAEHTASWRQSATFVFFNKLCVETETLAFSFRAEKESISFRKTSSFNQTQDKAASAETWKKITFLTQHCRDFFLFAKLESK